MDVLCEECLIYKIVAYLSFKEAAKMSLVSKTWLQAWLAHPNLEFTFDYVKGSERKTVVDQIMERYRDRKIPIEKFQLSISFSADLAFPWMDKWLRIALQNGVKDLVCKVSVRSYPFPIFTFLAGNSSRELVLSGCNLMKLSFFTAQAASCHSLRKLSLSNVRLDDYSLQTLLKCCPLIVDLIIAHCRVLTKIELLNLQNIKSVSISSNQNQSVEIQAPTLHHFSYFGCRWEKPPVLDIVECQNLKSLELSCMRISREFLQYLISTSQFLESLKLYDLSTGLERFKICGSQSLKFLAIEGCKGLRVIDAPNLVSLEYEGHQLPELKVAKDSGQLKNSRLRLCCWNDLNATWFGELRKFLSNSTSWSQVDLRFDECNEINMKDLELHLRVANPEVDVLDVHIESSGECPLLVDALLWSCHPRRLYLQSTIEMITCFMDRLMYTKNPSHSTCHGSKPWRSQLKEVKAYKFDSENQRVELRSGELAMRTLTEEEEVLFLLDW